MKVYIYSPNAGEKLCTFALSTIMVENHRGSVYSLQYNLQVFYVLHKTVNTQLVHTRAITASTMSSCNPYSMFLLSRFHDRLIV